MKSQLLKLDAPYHVIYAGGLVGRHIATMVTWTEDESGEMVDTVSYPIIDQGEEFPAGKMVMTDLDDCRCLCPPNGTNLGWVMKIIEYDYQQIDPAGPEYILERMKLLGCKIVMLMEKDDETGEMLPILDYRITLFITALSASWEEPRYYRVKSNRFDGFYFEAEGTAHEIYNDLHYQLACYKGFFHDEVSRIEFTTNDMELEDVIEKLNKRQEY
ncbi:MAG: hypothetical protein K6F89_05560 [Prevotella sp.]|nr:hypothetical protein [Prevotella sp.]